MDRGPALPPIAGVHERTISPLRPGVRSRVRRQGRFAGNLRTRLGAVECGRPCVGRTTRRAGGRGGRQAHAGGRRVCPRRAQQPVRLAAPRTAEWRTRAGHVVCPRDRPQPVWQRPRRTPRRDRAFTHGNRSHAYAAQGARRRAWCWAADVDRGLSRRREGGPADHEVGPAVPQLPRRQAERRRSRRFAARRSLSLVQHRLRT